MREERRRIYRPFGLKGSVYTYVRIEMHGDLEAQFSPQGKDPTDVIRDSITSEHPHVMYKRDCHRHVPAPRRVRRAPRPRGARAPDFSWLEEGDDRVAAPPR
jgi:hypothetical protein